MKFSWYLIKKIFKNDITLYSMFKGTVTDKIDIIYVKYKITGNIKLTFLKIFCCKQGNK